VGAQRTARGLGPVRLVHASSIAVYGAPMPARIEDDTQPWPTLSYGAHDREMDPQHNSARAKLDKWTAAKGARP